MENEPNTDLQAQADDATAEAVHKAKNAQAAIELARQAQLASAVEAAAQKTKDALLEGLKEVFGDSDSEDPTRMKCLSAGYLFSAPTLTRCTPTSRTSKAISNGGYALSSVQFY
jgi:hypothetical protein